MNKGNLSEMLNSFIKSMKDEDIGFYILNARNEINSLLGEMSLYSTKKDLNEELVKQMLDSFINELKKLKGENE